MKGSCTKCGLVGDMKACNACGAAVYCSTTCQKIHWKECHKEECKGSGRHAVPKKTKKKSGLEVGSTVFISGVERGVGMDSNGTIGGVTGRGSKPGWWHVKTGSSDEPIPLHERNLTQMREKSELPDCGVAHASGGGDSSSGSCCGGKTRASAGKPSSCKPATSHAEGKVCSHCDVLAEKPVQCAGCHQDVYCDASCQKAHWNAHKDKCRRFRTAAAALSREADGLAMVERRIELSNLPDQFLSVCKTRGDLREAVLAADIAAEQAQAQSARDPDDVTKDMASYISTHYQQHHFSKVAGAGQWFNDAGVLVSSNRPQRSENHGDEIDDPEFPCAICFGPDIDPVTGMPCMCRQCGKFVCRDCCSRGYKWKIDPDNPIQRVVVQQRDLNNLYFAPEDSADVPSNSQSIEVGGEHEISWECPSCRYKITSRDSQTEYEQAQLLALLQKWPKGRHASYAMWELANTFSKGEWLKDPEQTSKAGTKSRDSYRVPDAKKSRTCPQQAVRWLKEAADLGLSCAQTDLGNLYFSGFGGLKQDQAKACKLYLLAAEAGVSDAQHCIAGKFEAGLGVERDYKTAYKWFLKAAEQGHPGGQSNVHTMTMAGKGTDKDLAASFRWAKLAAGQGNSVAMANLGTAYMNPSMFGGNGDQDPLKARMWWERAAAAGDKLASLSLRQLDRIEGKSDATFESSKEAFLAYTKEGAFDGQPKDKFVLAYLYGSLDENSPFSALHKEHAIVFQMTLDVKKSIRWLKDASNQGYTDAQYCFGMAYTTGWGVERDHDEATRLLKLAADQNHEGAQKACELIEVEKMAMLHMMAMDGNSNAADLLEVLRQSEPELYSFTESIMLVTLQHQVLHSSNNDDSLSATTMLRKLLSKGRNPPIQEIIDLGVVPRFVEFLQRSEMPRLQFEAAWALTNIASGARGQTTTVIDAGAIPIFVDLLESSADDVREQAVWALGNIAGDGPGCRDRVLQAGVLAPLLRALNDKTSKIAMMRNAAWTLSNLCRGKNPPPDFAVVSESLPTLAKLMHYPDDEVLTDACWALSYLTDGTNDKIQKVVEAGVCRRLVELLMHDSTNVITPALRSIGNMVTGDDVQTQAVLACDLLPALLKLTAHSKGGIKKEACWTISNITAGSQAQIQAVIDGNLIPPVLDMLQNSDFATRKEAAWAISKATGGQPAQIQQLVAAGCIPPLCNILAAGDHKVVEIALDALNNILRVGVGSPTATGDNPYALEIEECGGVLKIEAIRLDSYIAGRQGPMDTYDLPMAAKIISKYFAPASTASTTTSPPTAARKSSAHPMFVVDNEDGDIVDDVADNADDADGIQADTPPNPLLVIVDTTAASRLSGGTGN